MDFIVYLQVLLQNMTPIQTAIAVGVVVLVAGTWFFSDGFNNKNNAVSFVFSYSALCVLLYLGYKLTMMTLQNPK